MADVSIFLITNPPIFAERWQSYRFEGQRTQAITRQSSDDQSYCVAQFLEARQAAVEDTQSKLLWRAAIKYGNEPRQLIVQAITYPPGRDASRTPPATGSVTAYCRISYRRARRRHAMIPDGTAA
jgi:hypothetical protein